LIEYIPLGIYCDMHRQTLDVPTWAAVKKSTQKNRDLDNGRPTREFDAA